MHHEARDQAISELEQELNTSTTRTRNQARNQELCDDLLHHEVSKELKQATSHGAFTRGRRPAARAGLQTGRVRVGRRLPSMREGEQETWEGEGAKRQAQAALRQLLQPREEPGEADEEKDEDRNELVFSGFSEDGHAVKRSRPMRKGHVRQQQFEEEMFPNLTKARKLGERKGRARAGKERAFRRSMSTSDLPSRSPRSPRNSQLSARTSAQTLAAMKLLQEDS